MTTEADPRQTMTVAEVAALTTLRESSLYTMRARGGGPPSYKIGKRLVYLAADVHAWLDAQYAETKSA